MVNPKKNLWAMVGFLFLAVVLVGFLIYAILFGGNIVLDALPKTKREEDRNRPVRLVLPSMLIEFSHNMEASFSGASTKELLVPIVDSKNSDMADTICRQRGKIMAEIQLRANEDPDSITPKSNDLYRFTAHPVKNIILKETRGKVEVRKAFMHWSSQPLPKDTGRKMMQCQGTSALEIISREHRTTRSGKKRKTKKRILPKKLSE